MIRNDYRRALIMLRPSIQGYSGHVRLERRTLIGSMYFIVNTPDGEGALMAALIGRKNCDYYVAPIGELRRDGRGQAGLPYSFDPRNIDGRELEDYQLVAVIQAENGICRLALTGNLNGACDIDPGGIQRAVCDAYAAIPEPAFDLPPGQNAPPVIPEPQFAPPEPPQRFEPPDIPPEPPEMKPRQDDDRPADAPALSYGVRPSAADLLEVDTDEPWAAAIEGLRAIFANEPAQSAFEEDDFVYVRAPLPQGSGYDYALIGLHEDDGRIDAVRYAIPARYSPEPPAGLEGYIWIGGSGDGWWVLTADPQTGEPLQNFDD